MAEELKEKNKNQTTIPTDVPKKKKKKKKKNNAKKIEEVKQETVKNDKDSKNTTKNESVKKVETKTEQKKDDLKKEEIKKVEKKIEEKTESKKKAEPKEEKETPKEKKAVEKNSKNVDLEKTLIFDSKANKNIREVVNKLEEDNVLLETKVIKRSKGRKIAIIVLTALILAIIVGVTAYVITDQIRQEENKQTLNSNIYKKVTRNYKTLSDLEEELSKSTSNSNTGNEETKADLDEEEIKYSNIQTITLGEFEEKILKKENMTILVSSETCYHCLTFEPTINEVFKESDKTIYRLNVVDLTQEEVTRFRTYYAFTVTPTIFTVKDGFATSETTGTMSKEDLTEWVKNNA